MVYFESSKKEKPETPLVTRVFRDFESGGIGEAIKLSNTGWELYLADDNGTPDLPDRWRNRWCVRMENVNTDSVTKLVLKNRG